MERRNKHSYGKEFFSFCKKCKLKPFLIGAQIIALCALYFVFSIGLTFYQKWFVQTFRYPITIVIFHLVIKFLLAAICRLLYEWKTKSLRTTLKWKDYVMKLGLIGFFCAIDIGLSNWSFEFITISLCGRMDTTCIPRAKLSRYTMSKSSTIIFILIFSIMLGLEKFKKSLVGIVLLIAGGLFMFTFHSTQFNLEGFILVMLAALTSGLRWTLAQLVMQKNEIGLGNPLDMVYHVQPWMILSLIPLFIGFEGESISRSILFNYEDVNVMLQIVGLMSIGAVIAFLMEISEYLLVLHTSSLTLSICGILKEILTLILAVKVNNNKMNSVNMLGLVLCILGISTHVVIKVLNNKKSSKEQIEVEMKGLLPFDNSSDEDELFDKNMLR
ncbi:Solute carrier family 35 member C2 [Nymphon striatum]|nr:Solute carrier family 35 member C2 [Nymphon striatum]